MAIANERIDSLEQVVRDFVRNVDIQFTKLYDSQRRTEVEMRGFKDEIREFKDEGLRQTREKQKMGGDLQQARHTRRRCGCSESTPDHR